MTSKKLSSQSLSSMNNRMGSISNLSPASSILLSFADSTAGNLLPPLFFHFLSSISVCLFASGEKVRSLYLEMQKVGLINGNLRAIDNLLGELTETEGRGVEEIDPNAGLFVKHSDGSKRWLGSADAIIAEVVLTWMLLFLCPFLFKLSLVIDINTNIIIITIVIVIMIVLHFTISPLPSFLHHLNSFLPLLQCLCVAVYMTPSCSPFPTVPILLFYLSAPLSHFLLKDVSIRVRRGTVARTGPYSKYEPVFPSKRTYISKDQQQS